VSGASTPAASSGGSRTYAATSRRRTLGANNSSPAATARTAATSCSGGAFPTLTDREREILELIARGHPNPSIARKLSLSPKTVANYVSAVFAKLQVADRAEAMIRAREAGLGG
jgi:DNA-binding NarL/FixJ family response regulator